MRITDRVGLADKVRGFGSIDAVGTDARRGTHPWRTSKKGRKKVFSSLLRYLRASKRYQGTDRYLSNLGDRELADVGIARKDIPRVA